MYCPALGLTVAEVAQALGVTRTALSRVLHGKAGISPEMALRMQVTYDLAQAAKTSQAVLQKVTAVDDTRCALAN